MDDGGVRTTEETDDGDCSPLVIVASVDESDDFKLVSSIFDATSSSSSSFSGASSSPLSPSESFHYVEKKKEKFFYFLCSM